MSRSHPTAQQYTDALGLLDCRQRVAAGLENVAMQYYAGGQFYYVFRGQVQVEVPYSAEWFLPVDKGSVPAGAQFIGWYAR